MVKVTIDQNTCNGCATCTALCEEVYELNDSGKAKITQEYQGENEAVGEVPDDVDCTEPAAEACPVEAIELE